MPDEPIRLSKLMAQRGLCSRREADEYISKGWVLVDGERVSTLGVKVSPAQTVTLDERARKQQTRLATFLLHKPVGYVSGQPEKGYQPAVNLIKPENRFARDPSPLAFHPAQLKGLAPAGRLDIDSQGLLVITQDGRIAKQLIGEHSNIEKEYLVRVTGEATADRLRRLRHGLELDGRPLKPARVERLNEAQLQFILNEGRKRQIRRMCEQVGLKVTALKRVRIGQVRLGDLPVGQWRYLGESESF
jgi:23S rRNA pseudouridine2604 synthase